MSRGNAHLTARGWRRASWVGRGLITPRPTSGFGGGTFLQPAPLQHGSAAVQHLCGGAAAAGGPEAGRRGLCGCCAVRAGWRVGERRARELGAGAGARVWVWGMGRLGLGIYGLEAGARYRPGEELSAGNGKDG